ncbi:hypothetical protein BDZ89DRAFT_1214075 [Hymenopellis radicata]|nr:hypothetical protein BDZ89DRAFT_1214075 [Hymenopellis radicata]
MLYRFISLFLVAALSVGALAYQCPDVQADYAAIKGDVADLQVKLTSFKEVHNGNNALACHSAAVTLTATLGKAATDAGNCHSPPDSEAADICIKIKGLAPGIYADLELVLELAPLFKQYGLGRILCNDMTSMQASSKLYVDAMLKLATPTNCPDAVKLAAALEAKIESTRATCCAGV